eukprot:757088-Hanusia_phi.AAC.9
MKPEPRPHVRKQKTPVEGPSHSRNRLQYPSSSLPSTACHRPPSAIPLCPSPFSLPPSLSMLVAAALSHPTVQQRSFDESPPPSSLP